jgi:hypothetical protein
MAMRRLRSTGCITLVSHMSTTAVTISRAATIDSPSTASHIPALWPAALRFAAQPVPTGNRGIACLPRVASAPSATAGARASVGLRVALGEVVAARAVGGSAVPVQHAQRISMRGFASSAKDASTSVAPAEATGMPEMNRWVPARHLPLRVGGTSYRHSEVASCLDSTAAI